jgi:hypothetical protein
LKIINVCFALSELTEEQKRIAYNFKAADISQEHYAVLKELKEKRRTTVKGSWSWLKLFIKEEYLRIIPFFDSLKTGYVIEIAEPRYGITTLEGKRRSEGKIHVKLESQIEAAALYTGTSFRIKLA